jgi:hypothetical protein
MSLSSPYRDLDLTREMVSGKTPIRGQNDRSSLARFFKIRIKNLGS